MNRIVLIGNGFDLAHGLKTSYADFIDWYWEQRVEELYHTHSHISDDLLCSFEIKDHSDWSTAMLYGVPRFSQKIPPHDVIQSIIENKDEFKSIFSTFFENILQSIETKRWVDIENEYYRLLTKYAIEEKSGNMVYALNNQLGKIRGDLIDYLKTINEQDIKVKPRIRSKIYSPIEEKDLSIGNKSKFKGYIDWCMEQEQSYWIRKMGKYGDELSYAVVEDYKKACEKGYKMRYPRPFMMPNNIMLLSFNYTKTASLYETNDFKTNYIHGRLENDKSVIFGYGDELDENYKKLQDFEDNDCLYNIKSIKYLEADNYRRVLDFIESDLFQICVMGHSCGNSDRTLLNTLFEHENCISIKPYYHKWDDGTDNYLEIVQNISRNFKDMKLMRDRVVNKTFCKTFTD